MYKLISNTIGLIETVQNLDDSSCIPFNPSNRHYVSFKKEINEEVAELQDADGNTMTAAEAKTYIATLP